MANEAKVLLEYTDRRQFLGEESVCWANSSSFSALTMDVDDNDVLLLLCTCEYAIMTCCVIRVCA